MAADGAAGGWPGRPGLVAPGRVVFSEALGAEICAAIAAGRSLMAFCREPGRPHRTTVKRWEHVHPEFGAALQAAYSQARAVERWSDRMQAAELAQRPPPRRGGSVSGYSRARGEAICARLAAGESLTSIARDPAFPSYDAIYRWVKRHPEFEAMYVEARAVQAERLCDEARDIAAAATVETVRLARLAFDVVRWQAARVAARKYAEKLEGHQAQMQALAAAKAQAAEAAAAARAEAEAGAPEHVIFHVTHFEVIDGRVLAAPPRNRKEALAWLEVTGKPYAEGVTPEGHVRPPPYPYEGYELDADLRAAAP